MNYSEIKKEDVIQTMAEGAKVVVCDFKTMRIANCSDMNIAGINSAIVRTDTKFFAVTKSDE